MDPHLKDTRTVQIFSAKMEFKFLKHVFSYKKINSCMTDPPTQFNPYFDMFRPKGAENRR